MRSSEHIILCIRLLEAPTLRNRYLFERVVEGRSALYSAFSAVMGRIIDGGKP